MGAGLTDSVIRFGFLVEWGDAHFSGLIRLLRTPFGRALTSSLIEPLVPRLPASECWRAMRRGWVWVLCGFL